MTAHPDTDTELQRVLTHVMNAAKRNYNGEQSYLSPGDIKMVESLPSLIEEYVKQAQVDTIVLACPNSDCNVAIVSSRELSRWNGTGVITDPPHATSVWIPCEKHYEEGATPFHRDKDGNEIPIDPRLWPTDLSQPLNERSE